MFRFVESKLENLDPFDYKKHLSDKTMTYYMDKFSRVVFKYDKLSKHAYIMDIGDDNIWTVLQKKYSLDYKEKNDLLKAIIENKLGIEVVYILENNQYLLDIEYSYREKMSKNNTLNIFCEKVKKFCKF